MPWHKLTSLSQICLSTCATSILPLSTLVERMVVLLGCSFFVAGLLLAEPDRHRLAGATRRLSAECLCTVCGSCGPVVPCKLLVSQWVLISVCETDFREEIKLLCGWRDKELPLKACWDCCQPTHYSWSATNQTRHIKPAWKPKPKYMHTHTHAHKEPFCMSSSKPQPIN